jgi:hypothetical protein
MAGETPEELARPLDVRGGATPMGPNSTGARFGFAAPAAYEADVEWKGARGAVNASPDPVPRKKYNYMRTKAARRGFVRIDRHNKNTSKEHRK